MSVSIVIGGREFTRFTRVSIGIRFDEIASSFDLEVYYDAASALEYNILHPLRYQPCRIYYHHGDGRKELMLTGVVLYHECEDAAEPSPVRISGYSKTGVLADVNSAQSDKDANFEVQYKNMSLLQIAEKLCKPFGIGVYVDASVREACSAQYPSVTQDIKHSIKDFLAELAAQKDVVLSHDVYGNLLLTSQKTTYQKTTVTETFRTYNETLGLGDMPGVSVTRLGGNAVVETKATGAVFDFHPGNYIRCRMVANGQGMHSQIYVYSQATESGAGMESAISNPYLTDFQVPKTTPLGVYRPQVVVQTSGDSADSHRSARHMLAKELRSLSWDIEHEGWEIGKRLVMPNIMISLTSPGCYLKSATRLFVESVDYYSDESRDSTMLKCVLPEVYNKEKIKNVFG